MPHQTAAEGHCGDLRPPQAFSGGARKVWCAVEKGQSVPFICFSAQPTGLSGAPSAPQGLCPRAGPRALGPQARWEEVPLESLLQGPASGSRPAAPEHSLLL